MPEVQVERVNSPSPAGIWSEIGPEIDIEAVIYSAVGSAAAHIDSAAVKPALSACALSEVEHATQPDRPFTTIAPHAGRTGFPFDFEHWCRRQTRCEQPAHDPTAPSALADPGLVLVKGPDRPDL